MFYTCYNCHINLSIKFYLKRISPSLYSQYCVETFIESKRPQKSVDDQKQDKIKSLVASSRPNFGTKRINLASVDTLDDEHIAKKYVLLRKIPEQFYKELYYAPDFKKFADDIFPDNDKKIRNDDERLVIPFYDESKTLLGIQGRTLTNSDIRYYTIKQNKSSTKIYGLDRLNKNKRVYVVEGPIDSMFVDNCVATMDSALYRIKDVLKELNYIFVYDNEPRNKDVINCMKKTIRQGDKIVIWPNDLEYKDINDMANAGIDFGSIISNNIYSGIVAELEFKRWSKI